MIQGRNIICIASDWFYDPTSKHHVMRVLSERNHIIWVNYHGSRRPRISGADVRAAAGKLRRFIRGPQRVAENITVITPIVVPLPGNQAVAALNRRLLVRQIRSVLRKLPCRPAQLWSFAPDVDFLCGQFDEERIVYYCVDEFSEFTGYDREAILAAERRLAGRADLVVTTSTALHEAKRSLNSNTVLVPHGVDVDHFARASRPETVVPAEIASLPRPVLGFWGLIQDWLDTELLTAAARARPEWSFVLIGETATDVARLQACSNVHLLGRRAYADLPAYAKGFDVGLIPFRVNALTRAVNPIKLREYLSAGLPVVSTALPEVVRHDLVEIATDAISFVGACERAIVRSSAADRVARRDAMMTETWEAKVVQILGHLATPDRSADLLPLEMQETEDPLLRILVVTLIAATALSLLLRFLGITDAPPPVGMSARAWSICVGSGVWIVSVLVGAASGHVIWRRSENDGIPQCRGCGYILTGNHSGRCPECGTDIK